jgi:hypothetical protein
MGGKVGKPAFIEDRRSERLVRNVNGSVPPTQMVLPDRGFGLVRRTV